MKHNAKIARHLHIPVQSCDNDILKAMNRPYTVEEYKNRINYIRSQIPDISISTDLIVGFPNETEERFENTLNQLKEIRFSFIHVFPYSRKTKTAADRMEGHVDPKTKKQRVRTVMDLEKDTSAEFKKRFIGKRVRVLIERHDENCSYGYSKEYIYTRVNGVYEAGTILDVIIEKAEDEVIGNVAE
jgi:threonylcarbamoyladenosine tRNA methylthiotransferase MtaB